MTDNGDRRDSESTRSLPEPGPTAPASSWATYDRLEAALEAYLDADPSDPKWRDIWRGLAAMLGKYQRDAFLEAFELTAPAETACIHRLITGAEACPHRADSTAASGPPEGPPHSPPGDDHATLWLDADDEPALYGLHVYPGNIERLDAVDPPYNRWFDLFDFAAEWGLEVSVLPKSWYNLGSTVHVVFYPPERYRTANRAP